MRALTSNGGSSSAKLWLNRGLRNRPKPLLVVDADVSSGQRQNGDPM